jgi:hypothetical protein
MKKKLLVTLCLLLSLNGVAFCAEAKNQSMESEVKQKACQNVFSLINIDLSLFSPRAAVADVNVPNPQPCPRNCIAPITNKNGMMMPPPPMPRANSCQSAPPAPPAPPKNKTSLFRIDLLGLFKIQIL